MGISIRGTTPPGSGKVTPESCCFPQSLLLQGSGRKPRCNTSLATLVCGLEKGFAFSPSLPYSLLVHTRFAFWPSEGVHPLIWRHLGQAYQKQGPPSSICKKWSATGGTCILICISNEFGGRQPLGCGYLGMKGNFHPPMYFKYCLSISVHMWLPLYVLCRH